MHTELPPLAPSRPGPPPRVLWLRAFQAPRILLDLSVQIPPGPTCPLTPGSPGSGRRLGPGADCLDCTLSLPGSPGTVREPSRACRADPPAGARSPAGAARRGPARLPEPVPAMARARPPPPPLPPGLLPLLSPLLLLPLLLPAGCRALEGERRRGSASKG